MTRRVEKNLSAEDRVLWSLVARSATPLKGKIAVELPVAEVPPQPTPALQPELAF